MNDTTNWHFGVAYWIARDSHGNKIYNNVGYNNRINLRISGDFPLEDDNMTDNKVKNNIFEGAVTSLFGLELDARFWDLENNMTGLGNEITYNCFGTEYTNFIMWANNQYKSTYDTWETAYGSTTNSVESDPLFTDAANADFTLKANSPAIDAGTNLGATYKLDYSGSDQYNDSRWDIGAYRFRKRGGIPVSFFTY